MTALGEALALCEKHGPSWHLGTSSLNLGHALLHQSRPADAGGHFERALAIYEELGDKHFTARALVQLGYTGLAQGDPEAAGRFIDRALALATELGDAWSIAEVLEAAADVVADDSPSTTAMLGGAAESLRERISMRQHPADARINRVYVESARQRLGSGNFASAWAEGRLASIESALDTARTATGAVRPRRHRRRP
jgi:tetratricopeptide (TPR) repeat protein